jgi:hypothetical protein
MRLCLRDQEAHLGEGDRVMSLGTGMRKIGRNYGALENTSKRRNAIGGRIRGQDKDTRICLHRRICMILLIRRLDIPMTR